MLNKVIHKSPKPSPPIFAIELFTHLSPFLSNNNKGKVQVPPSPSEKLHCEVSHHPYTSPDPPNSPNKITDKCATPKLWTKDGVRKNTTSTRCPFHAMNKFHAEKNADWYITYVLIIIEYCMKLCENKATIYLSLLAPKYHIWLH